jgi:hypothetical protein
MLFDVNAIEESWVLRNRPRSVQILPETLRRPEYSLTIASTRLLVQHTRMLGRLRSRSRAVRSWFVACIGLLVASM